MRKRSSNLLLHFLQTNRHYSSNKITEFYQISLRTLRSDLVEINDFLCSINEPLFYIDESGNIQNEGIINIDNTKKKLYSINNYSYRCNQTERQLLIFAILINQNSYITMEYLAEKLFVSRITILNDIELIKEVLVNYSNCYLSSKSSKGIKLEVNCELSLRCLLIDMLKDIVIKINDENVFLHILERELGVEYSVNQIASILRKYENGQHVLFSDESFYEIVLYFFITFYRFQQSCLLSTKLITNLDSIKCNVVINNILDSYLSALPIIMTTQETILTANGIEYNRINIISQHIEDVELYKIVVYFLSKIAIPFQANLEKDQLLIDSLVMHIKNMFDGVNFDFSWEDEFQEQFWDILDDINKQAFILERYLMRTLSEKMKFSIFIHVCAALIRNKKYHPSLRVLVVCPGSMATGRFVEAQLNNYFNFRITDVVSVDRVLNTIKDRGDPIDFIVSTVDVETDLCPIIIVEPILTNADFNKIQNLVTKIGYKSEEPEENINHSILKPIMAVFDKLDENHQGHFLADIEKVTNQYSATIKHKANTNIVQMLGNSENIKIVNQKIDWINAIKLSGDMLLMKNCIDKNYIDEMINNIHQYGPYIKVGKKIAIAHAKPEKYVYCEGLSLLLSQQGIYFDEESENAINLMFCFSTMGNLEYIDLFWQIAHLGNDECFIDLLLSTKTASEAYQLISNRITLQPII